MVQDIQAVQIQQGLNAVTSTDGVASDGVFADVKVVHCREDGDIVVTFRSGQTETVSLVAGEDRTLNSCDIEISSGTFDLNM